MPSCVTAVLVVIVQKVGGDDDDQKIKNENWKSKMLLQVHDELVFDVLKSEKEGFEKMVKTEMEKAFDIGLPLLVDMGFGANWLEAH